MCCNKCTSCLHRYVENFLLGKIGEEDEQKPPTIIELEGFYAQAVKKHTPPEELEKIKHCIEKRKSDLSKEENANN